jgi:hypothetical protein
MTVTANRMSPQALDLARELVAAAVDQGRISVEQGAQDYAELAQAATGTEIDLSNALDDVLAPQWDHATQVAAEDSAPQPRSAEARLARSLSRIAAGTYQPGTLEFSSASTAARELARARWGAHQPGPVTGRANCGPSDDLGYCTGPFHDPSCGSIASTEIGEAMRETGAYRRLASQPFADSNGRTWSDQHGDPVTLTGHVEAASGERLRDGAAFETGHGRRSLTTPQRVQRFADPSADPGTDAGTAVPRETAALTGLAAMAMGLPRHRPASERGVERLADHALRRPGGPHRVHPDFGGVESPRERRERISAERGTGQLRAFGDEPVCGSLGYYEAG